MQNPGQDSAQINIEGFPSTRERWDMARLLLINGSVTYQPDPLDPPAEGNVLICCSRPQEDMVINI